MGRQLAAEEVQKHTSPDSCWVVLYGKVWDVTKFLPEHPGGSSVILRLAGQDATEQYDPVHPPGTLEDNLPESACLGEIDVSTLPKPETSSPSSPAAEHGDASGPAPLESLINLDDVEAAAKERLNRKAWAYYYSAADDLYSKKLNNAVYRRILLRPRIFVDCTRCDLSTSLLSVGAPSSPGSHPAIPVSTPFFVSPAAMARLAHPSGEAGIAAACAKFGAAQVISNNASMTPEQIVEAASDDQVFGWQLYVQTDRRKSERMLQRINALRPKVKFIVLTLDAPVPGKREDDERAGLVGGRDTTVTSAVHVENETHKGQDNNGGGSSSASGGGGEGGMGRQLFAGTACDLTWEPTLAWLAQHTDLPVVIKGVQTHEDALLASSYARPRGPVRGILLSNHGGRAADTAPPAMHTLLEIRHHCPWVLGCLDVWVDGGIRRGTDVVKALCLGARAVGLGRAALYGLAAAGPAGVERVFESVSRAMTATTNMRRDDGQC